jgi:anti-sigma regulatory factor (Ser/Thr protein kinase)
MDEPIRIYLPSSFNFHNGGIHDFNDSLSIFDWSIKNKKVFIDLNSCTGANYQTLSLLVLYIWRLKAQGCWVEVLRNNYARLGASEMWATMGAQGWASVLRDASQNFNGNKYKPLLAIRDQDDFKQALKKVEEYAKGFNVEYEKTLRYIVTELLYNTLEHGRAFLGSQGLPSIIQFTWYRKRNTLELIVGDLGIGIKKHLEQTYPPFEDHASAILYSLQPQVSGTFGRKDPYTQKDNAGMGLYISSSIARKLKANLHIVSGDGLVHVSQRDVTSRTLKQSWPGTFVLVEIELSKTKLVALQKMMADFREEAANELSRVQKSEDEKIYYLDIFNYFGAYAEDKTAAIKHRDSYLINAITEGKNINVNFDNVVSAPHSFLSALFATPIKRLGMQAYKRIKFFNTSREIRETLDYIFDENTNE